MDQRKIFKGKEIKIKELSQKDLKLAKNFLNFYNSLIKEEVQIANCKRKSLAEEKKWLKEKIKGVRAKEKVVLFARDQEKVVGCCGIELLKDRRCRVGELAISIRAGYRGIGLGSYLVREILKLAKKRLKPKIKMLRLEVFATNRAALSFYKELGFKIVAKIPKQIEYKGKLIDEIVMIKNL